MYQNTVQRCLDGQPEALRSVVRAYKESVHEFVAYWKDRRITQVLLVGIGSSCFSVGMAREAVQDALQAPSLVFTPEQLQQTKPLLQEGTLVIAASQSGTSSNTLEAIRAAHAHGLPVTAVTQGADSYIAKESDIVVPLAIAEEKAGPKTMGVVGTAATIMLMAAALGAARRISASNAADVLADELLAEADAMEDNISASKQWFFSLKDQMAEHTAWIVVGQKRMHPTANEAALKLVETIRMPVTSYELEEIIHGPRLCLYSKPALLLLQADDENHTRPEALADLCDELGGDSYRVQLHSGKPDFNGRRLQLTCISRRLAGLQLLIPGQIISAYLPPVIGIDLDQSDDSSNKQLLAGHLD